MNGQAYLRSVGVKFGPASPAIAVDLVQTLSPDPFKGLQRSFGNENDDGIRVQFDILRTLSSEPDRCTLTLWNLSQKSHDAIVSDYEIRQASRRIVFRLGLPSTGGARAEALQAINDLHSVGVFAGYVGEAKALFVGDYMRISARERDGFTDFRTVIELGDSILSTRDAYLDNPIGPGAPLGAVIGDIITQAGWSTSPDAAVKLAKLTPEASVQAFTGGAIGSVPAKQALNDLGFLTKTRYFVREGVVSILGDEDVLEDFAIALVEGRDVLDFTKGKEAGEASYRTNLNGSVEPGRAIYVFDAERKQTGVFRCEAARYVGDTHGNDWFTEFDVKPYTGVPVPFDVSVLS